MIDPTAKKLGLNIKLPAEWKGAPAKTEERTAVAAPRRRKHRPVNPDRYIGKLLAEMMAIDHRARIKPAVEAPMDSGHPNDPNSDCYMPPGYQSGPRKHRLVGRHAKKTEKANQADTSTDAPADPYPLFPGELKNLERFGLYKLEWNEGLKKNDKPPYNARTGFKGNPVNPADRSSYEIVKAVLSTNKHYSGAGFGLKYSDGYTCTDFDHCVNAGVIDAPIQKILDETQSYAEFSPGGDGIHLWTKGYQVPIANGQEGRKVGNAEMYSGKHYMTVTGKHVPGTPLTIESRDLSGVYARICAGDFVVAKPKKPAATGANSGDTAAPRISPRVVNDGSTTHLTTKLELLMHGTIDRSAEGFTVYDAFGNSLEPYFPSQSEADQSLVTILIYKHKGDVDKADEDFRDSALYREKWEREDYRRSCFNKALESYSKYVEQITRTAAGGDLVFSRPAVLSDHPETEHLEYAFGPALGQWDGLFPVGDISLIGGSSGGGKSTLFLDWLDKQKRCEPVLGHASFGLNFLIIQYDRKKNAYKRTMKRLGLEGREKDFPTAFLAPSSSDPRAIAQEIIEKIEKQETLPEIIFVEGGDIASADPSKSGPTKQFLGRLQAIAEYYHLAIILSVGIPKLKIGEGYAAQRDHIFGSVFWGRMAETMMVMHYIKGDDTGSRRKLFVLLRNAPAEKFNLIFENGKLVVDLNPELEDEGPEEWWFAQQGEKYFTALQLARGITVSRATARRMCEDAVKDGILRRKTGPRTGPGGGSKHYQWIDESKVVFPALSRDMQNSEPDKPGGLNVEF